MGAKSNHWIMRVLILLGLLSWILGKGKNNKSGYYPKPKRKLITSSYDVIITSMIHHEHIRMATILSRKSHQHSITSKSLSLLSWTYNKRHTTRTATILSETHTSHIMLSTHPHNIINISIQHHKHTNTS